MCVRARACVRVHACICACMCLYVCVCVRTGIRKVLFATSLVDVHSAVLSRMYSSQMASGKLSELQFVIKYHECWYFTTQIRKYLFKKNTIFTESELTLHVIFIKEKEKK